MTILSTANLIFFPGIAANQRTFEYIKPHFPNLYVPPWLPLQSNEPLQNYVTRLIDSIPADRIQKPFYLGGHSFGGVLAQEIALKLNPQGIFLISGFRTHQGISPLFKMLEHLTWPIPHWLLTPLVAPYRYIAPILRRGSKEQLDLLVSMFYDTPLEITRWGAHCSIRYTGTSAITAPIYHIHGSADPLLPIKYAKPNAIIHRGTHLIPITHAPEVAQFIAAHLP